MSRLILVDDDLEQLWLRKLLLEHSGHEVRAVTTADAARAAVLEDVPDIIVLDLHLGRDGDGLGLIRELRGANPGMRIAVFSGWTADLIGREEAKMVDAIVTKPARTERLLKALAKLAMVAMLSLLIHPLEAQRSTFPFQVDRAGEAIAEITMSAPGANWAKTSATASVADVRVDDGTPFQIMVYSGETRQRYPVFLGSLPAGPHRISVVRNEKESAPGAGLAVEKVDFQTGLTDEVLAHAPVLYARANTAGKFSDIPLLVYAEKLRDGADPILQYTVIFSNEDGGTSTRALMARWGRTTDIEYVYRLNLGNGKAIIQSRDHKEVEFAGKRDGSHPLLQPVTDNNMVAAVEGDLPAALRYQIAPVLVDLSAHSRENVMDDRPLNYRVMGEELIREGKLRPFATVDGEKISDPRNYLYVEMKVTNRTSGVSVNVRLRDESIWRSGDLGRVDYAISRSEWVRTTVELPPAIRADQIAEIGLACVVAPGPDRRMQASGECRVEAVTKAFLLDREYKPGSSVWSLPIAIAIPTGEMRTYAVRAR